MPLKYQIGNLLNSDCDVIAHCANCFCTMGAGIAKQIKYKYPEAFEADCETEAGDISKLGSLSVATPAEGPTIINLYGQYRYDSSLPTIDYKALESSLKKMKLLLNEVDKNGLLKVGAPRLGAGLAGGDWNIIATILEKVFNDRTLTVYSL